MVRRNSMSGVGGKPTQRLQLACEPCRAAKLKCDRTLPVCEQCFKRSRESACKYTEKGLRYISVAQKASSMREKIERLELLVSRLKEPQATEAASATVEGQNDSPCSQESSEPSSHTGSIKLSKSGSTTWVGPSHWESIIEDVADVKAFIELQEAVEGLQHDDAHSSIPHVDVTLGTSNVLTKEDLLNRMPPRTDMDRLVAAWFNIMDPARIVIHAPTFQKQYRRFWLSPTEVDPALLSLILAMASLGAEISGQSLGDASTLAQAEFLGKLTAHAFILADSSRPQPHIIEALLLYVISLLYRRHDTTTQIWHIIGLTMRLCYQAGYHRDPSRNPNISRFDAEMRRRVWMVACELDISISNTLGMVGWLKYDLCDTAFPENLLDDDFSPNHFSPARSHEECTLVQIEIAFTRVIMVLGDIVASTHAVKAASMTEVQLLHKRLVEARDRLPEKLKMVPLEQCFIDSPFEIAERIRIEIAYQRALCILYRRFVGMPSCETEHRRCLEAAHTIVNHCISTLEAAQPGGQLAPLKVVFIRHIHDFILGAMLLCLELKRLASSDGDRLRVYSDDKLREMLFKACRLWNTPGLPSTKAQVALDTIMRFLTSSQSMLAQSNPEPQGPVTPADSSRMSGFGISTQAFNIITSSNSSNFPTPPDGSEARFVDPNVFSGILDPSYAPGGDLDLPWSWPPSQQSIGVPADGTYGPNLDVFTTLGIGEWADPSSDRL